MFNIKSNQNLPYSNIKNNKGEYDMSNVQYLEEIENVKNFYLTLLSNAPAEIIKNSKIVGSAYFKKYPNGPCGADSHHFPMGRAILKEGFYGIYKKTSLNKDKVQDEVCSKMLEAVSEIYKSAISYIKNILMRLWNKLKILMTAISKD